MWFINDSPYEKGQSTSLGHNCLIDALRQCLHLSEGLVDASLIRSKLQEKYNAIGDSQVTNSNFLTFMIHTPFIVDLLLQMSSQDKTLDHTSYSITCINISGIDGTIYGGGDHLQGRGDSAHIYIACENTNHFVPFLPLNAISI